MRWIGAAFVLAGSCGLGWYYSLRLQRQERTLLLGQQYIQMLRGIIAFGAQPLPEAMEEIAARSRRPWRGFFRDVASDLNGREKQFADIWKQRAEEQLTACLTVSDLESLIRTGQNLGHLDKSMQLTYLDMLRKEMEDSYENMRQKNPERCRLYRACGILGGLFLVIFLI